jgi:rfaE bifunctional protein kinase chain/domain
MKNLISKERLNEIISKFENLNPIIVLGDVGIDKYTMGKVGKISPEAPVPVLEVTKEWLKLGLASNVSHNLQAVNVKSVLTGVIGTDSNSNVFENLLEELNLSTWGLVRCDERPTIFKERVTTPQQQICRIDYESLEPIGNKVADKLFKRIHDHMDQHKGEKTALILEDYAKGTLTESLLKNIISEFKNENCLLAVDPGRTTPPLFYKGVDLLKPNRVEAEIMVQSLGYNEKNIEKMGEILMDKLDLNQLIITLGPDGMALIDREVSRNLTIIPTVANEVFDVSGAGDTAISLLTASLLAGASLEEAAWIGNCASGVVVAKTGTATVDQEELKKFHSKLLENL